MMHIDARHFESVYEMISNDFATSVQWDAARRTSVL